MTTRVYNRYQSSSFSAGQGFETVETQNYTAEIDDELARHLLKAFPQFFRAEEWPDGLKITDEAVMGAMLGAEGDPELEGNTMSDNSINMNIPAGDAPADPPADNN